MYEFRVASCSHRLQEDTLLLLIDTEHVILPYCVYGVCSTADQCFSSYVIVFNDKSCFYVRNRFFLSMIL